MTCLYLGLLIPILRKFSRVTKFSPRFLNESVITSWVLVGDTFDINNLSFL